MNYPYDVAISFAGENRRFAEAVATGLKEAGVNVFYDDFYASDLWGEDLSVSLRKVYHEASRFCIMVISASYVEKMWTNFERQQAIERLIKQKGQSYILPVRLDGYKSEVPGLSGMIGFLLVDSSQPDRVIDTFLKKTGKEVSPKASSSSRKETGSSFIPRLAKGFTDKEKNQFLKASFDEIVHLLQYFADETRKQYPHFDYEVERITTRKAAFILYKDEQQLSQFKVWIGGMFGSNSILFTYGNHIDLGNDSSMNESLSVEDHNSELVLKPMGMGMVGAERDSLMTAKQAAEYLWKMACQYLT
jgi:hypothetical protein